MPLARKLERRPVDGGDGKAGIGDFRYSGGKGRAERESKESRDDDDVDDEFDGDDDRWDQRGEG